MTYHYSCLDFLSQINYSLRFRSASVIKPSLSRTKSFKNTFFLYCINEWSNITVEIRNSKSVNAFKQLIKCKKNDRYWDIQMSWHNQMPKHETRNTYYWITWEANTVW